MRHFFTLLTLALILASPKSSLASMTGTVSVDGSSTVYPITAAIAEDFQRNKDFRKVRVTVAYSGTGGGFKKWCKGETDINDASRPIKQKEIDCAKKNGIHYLQLPVANDGISVVLSKKNTFLKSLSMEELKKLWEPGSKIKTWKQLNAKYPDKEIKFYGPGPDSGTFDYFTEAVMHKSRASRSDYVASEDDNVLVKGVSASPFALGYFGYAYYQENKRTLRALPISAGRANPIMPNDETIEKATYPLARPIFIYVSSKSVKKPEVVEFIRFYLKNVPEIAKSVGYTALKPAQYTEASEKFENFLNLRGQNSSVTRPAE